MIAITIGTTSWRSATSLAAGEVAYNGAFVYDADGLTPLMVWDAGIGNVRAMTAQEIAALPAQRATALRAAANDYFNADPSPPGKAFRAFVLTLLDEINTLRAAIPRRVVSITRVTTVATVTTDGNHGLAVGNPFAISGADVATYNVAGTVATVPSATTFTYAVANAGVTPATGSIFWTRGAVPSMADRTVALLRTAIQGKLDAGTAD